jgi:hypothetical protein
MAIASRVRKFDIANTWAPVERNDSRVRQYLAVVRYTINGLYLAAINVAEDKSPQGDWYTTITDAAEEALPFGDYADWSEIATYGQHLEVVTAWAQLI